MKIEFLDASTHLYKRVCQSFNWSIHSSVHPSVCLSVNDHCFWNTFLWNSKSERSLAVILDVSLEVSNASSLSSWSSSSSPSHQDALLFVPNLFLKMSFFLEKSKFHKSNKMIFKNLSLSTFKQIRIQNQFLQLNFCLWTFFCCQFVELAVLCLHVTQSGFACI